MPETWQPLLDVKAADRDPSPGTRVRRRRLPLPVPGPSRRHRSCTIDALPLGGAAASVALLTLLAALALVTAGVAPSAMTRWVRSIDVGDRVFAIFGVVTLTLSCTVGLAHAWGAFFRRKHGREGWGRYVLHWSDWRRLPDTTVTLAEAEPYLMLREDPCAKTTAQPRLRVIEALVAAGSPVLTYSCRVHGDHLNLLRLTVLGVPAELLRKCVQDLGGERVLVRLFEAVPDLTVDDLDRWSTHGLNGLPARAGTSDVHYPDYLDLADAMRVLYARHGRLASYFDALELTPAERDAAQAAGVSEDSLAVMVALTD